MGAHNSLVKTISDETGARVNIPPLSLNKDEITVAGEKECVAKAVSRVWKLLDELVSWEGGGRYEGREVGGKAGEEEEARQCISKEGGEGGREGRRGGREGGRRGEGRWEGGGRGDGRGEGGEGGGGEMGGGGREEEEGGCEVRKNVRRKGMGSRGRSEK